MADEALQEGAGNPPTEPEGSAEAGEGAGVSTDASPTIDTAPDEALHIPPSQDGAATPPPLLVPEGMVFMPTCAGCGLQFAEPIGNRPCPNCGTPVV